MPIETPDDLREHLLLALRVELATIPPYLYALYSIEDQESDAAGLLKSIATEEMLHAALVTNLLLAVGGEPDFLDPGIAPAYPSLMAHHQPDLTLHLAPASDAHIRSTFMIIEQPEAVGALPEEDDYETLGQFYAAVERAFERLAAGGDLFANHQPDRQIANPAFYGAVKFDAEDSGGLFLIHDIETAKAAIEIIVHQGEGISDTRWADPLHQELTHYAKLLQIVEGECPLGQVRPARVDPCGADYPPAIRRVSDLFNASYRATFTVLEALIADDPEKWPLVGRLYQLMTDVLAPTARYLMEQPLADGTVAGPTFEPYEFGPDPFATLQRLAADVSGEHPRLARVARALMPSDLVMAE